MTYKENSLIQNMTKRKIIIDGSLIFIDNIRKINIFPAVKRKTKRKVKK